MRSPTTTGHATRGSRSEALDASLPNVVVIGAQKCGTTSLHYYLDQHPEISMARAKELNFFVEQGSWRRGVDWYAAQFDRAAAVRGESSPSYTNYPLRDGVPERMHTVIPDARLVYLVRDPIERLVSHYVHAYSAGREDRPIEQALADGIAGHPYVVRSKYFLQLERYLPYFAAERILILAQEDLLHDRTRTLRQVFEFLGVDASFSHARFQRVKHRTSSDRRRKTRLGVTASRAARSVTLGRQPPDWIAWKAQRLLVFPLSRRIERPVVDDSLRKRLGAVFEADVRQLREFTGKEFESWSV